MLQENLARSTKPARHTFNFGSDNNSLIFEESRNAVPILEIDLARIGDWLDGVVLGMPAQSMLTPTSCVSRTVYFSHF